MWNFTPFTWRKKISSALERGKIPHLTGGLTQGNWCWEYRVIILGVVWGGGGWDLTGRDIYPLRGLAKNIKCMCVCVSVCAWGVRVEKKITNACGNSISVILAFLTFLPVNFQSLWGSLFQSCDIMRGVPRSASRSLTNPPIFGSERKGIPDDDSKAPAAKGNSLHICFRVCVYVSIINACQCVHYLHELRREFSCVGNSKMPMWLKLLQ